MTDLNKLRSEFEAVTETYHCIYNADLDYYFSGSKFVSDKAEIEVNAGWKAWKKAKAQAVPDTPTPSVTLTCAELKEAFDFGAPDGEKDQFQMETEMTIKWLQDGYDGEGYYCWYADLPEEGCIKLGVSESEAEG
ncbi:hypothetical protein [Acinetobacter baumannii]|nr:hypothetical protein [Acinetobacter baumannii]EKL8018362.1 hypothetical protein [Acinetobacter baumannii]EKU0801052.1 hypothetical protein [Acinetobacter baumannii]EKU1714500.1 hypothetical protein [Acinetobacter baumannii]EKU4274803.1 hypothetical protein [Acinetobacter baumannii]EKV7999761.1 hypothetical protein [Acinetobacter baumannii]